MADRDDVLRQHGYHQVRVKAVLSETDDARSLVLDVPDELAELFAYRPGQFCTFRVHLDDEDHARCYSMSSAPETGDDLTVTVKRVPGGLVSNWLNDHVLAGDLVEVSRPAGAFCVRPGDRPVIGFCGGSGVTPVMSITRSVLASSSRPVRLLYANRDAGSVIFDRALRELQARHRDRLEVRHHLDSDGGYLDAGAIVDFVGDALDADFYLCGPAPFMDLVERTLLGLGVEPDAVFIERFVTPGQAGQPGAPPDAGETAGSLDKIGLILKGRKHEVDYRAGDTVLDTARRANLSAPYSCEAGNCATCMAQLLEGEVAMRVNNALTPDEVEEGWVLTCQSVPTSGPVTIEYEAL
jgi:3-ketosteroid 9alpha-monooxygenase subunit B